METTWWDEYGAIVEKAVGGIIDYKMKELELTEGKPVRKAATAETAGGVPSWLILAGGAVLVYMIVVK